MQVNIDAIGGFLMNVCKLLKILGLGSPYEPVHVSLKLGLFDLRFTKINKILAVMSSSRNAIII